MKLHYQDGSCGHSCCLRVEHLGVRIGTEQILKDVNLHVHCGQMVALIGPNGAGKSTFLKAILGQREYEGVISFTEPGQRSKKPLIGYVPQSPAFDPSDPVSVADLFACCMSRTHSRTFEDAQREEKKAAKKPRAKKEDAVKIDNQPAATTLGDIDVLAQLKAQMEKIGRAHV